MKPHLPLSLRKALYAAMALSCAGAFAYSMTIPAPFLPADLVDSATETAEELSLPAVLSFTASPPLRTAASPAQPSMASATSTPAVASAEPASSSLSDSSVKTVGMQKTLAFTSDTPELNIEEGTTVMSGSTSTAGSSASTVLEDADDAARYVRVNHDTPITERTVWEGYSREVIFQGNSAGAILASNSLTFNNNGTIRFSGNTASSGGAIYAMASVEFRDNGDINFSSNSATSSGGAIYAMGSMKFSGNGDIDFSSNSSDHEYGSAIYVKGDLSFSDNDSVRFSANSFSGSSTYYQYGGAIYTEGALSFVDNGSVTFSDNTASGNNLSTVTGGAIYAGGDLSFIGNDSVSFCNNIVGFTVEITGHSGPSWRGGAIYAGRALNISDNSSVLFSGNAAARTSGYGGAIYALGDVSISGNSTVSFGDNSALVDGGAIYACSKLSFNNNGDIDFSGNHGTSYGGAIYAKGELLFSNNGTVSFSRNMVDIGYYYGGAICAEDKLSFIDNRSLSFSGNGDDSYGWYGYGGAIYAKGELLFSNSGDMNFSGNVCSYYGGAIYACSTLSFCGNGDLSFSDSRAGEDGGAIYAKGELLFSDNGDISFSGNSGYSGRGGTYSTGGAIFAESKLSFIGNDSVCVSGNTAGNRGGAIRACSELVFNDNSVINFSDNNIFSASNTSYPYGGAIYAETALSFTGNGSIRFSDNIASGNNWTSVTGGAIYAKGGLLFSGNVDISFCENSSGASGGAIYAASTLSFNNNEAISFSKNDVGIAGGAVYAASEVSFTNNAVISFNESHAGIDGGAIYVTSTLSFNNNNIVRFSENVSTGNDYDVSGGAIYGNSDSALSFSNNGDILFEGNSAVVEGTRLIAIAGGGAISTLGTLSLLDNSSITFKDNDATLRTANVDKNCKCDEYIYGGAIEGYSVLFSGNGAINFCGNSAFSAEDGEGRLDQGSGGGAVYASGELSFNDNDSITFSGNRSSGYGGAIYAKGDLIFSGNGVINFSDNSSSRGGGAIYTYKKSGLSLSFSDNGDISFSGNSSGAIDAGSALSFNNNGDISFSENSSDAGGAILANGKLLFSDNGDISFSENSSGSGGAICTNGELLFSDNGDISFSGNRSNNSGGAIYGTYGRTLSFSNNDAISFSGNSSRDDGGAIYANGDLLFNSNGDITVSGNLNSGSISKGGAIYSRRGALTIQGAALFEKNIESWMSSPRLRSIYQESGNGTLELSAASGKSIEFRDSIYSGASSAILNRDYAKSDGSMQRADGTIRFTGATAAADLAEMKGSAGTTEELTNSLTSVITGQVQLMGGTLAVEDGAILQVGGLITTDDAPADIMLHNGSLSALAEDGAITLGSGSILSMSGTSSLSGAISTVEHIQATVDLSLAQQGVAQLGLYGSLLTSGIELTITGLPTVDRGTYVLLDASATLAEGQHWQDIVSANLTEGEASLLRWDGNRLLYDCNLYSYIYSDSSSPLLLTEDRTWQDYDVVRFKNNTSGAINDADGGYTATFSGCGTVAFDGNSSDASGGAMRATVNISDCDEVTFSGNSTNRSGGAISGRTTISDCGTVTFSGNGASLHGGALYGNTTMSDCGTLTFSGNSSSVYGGAIEGNTTISACGTVTFSGNRASMRGGAIAGTTTISDCGTVTFSGNSSGGYGGAIYGSEITIQGSALFEKNTEFRESGGSYRLRSIYQGEGGTLELSAARGKSIEFRDSIYSGASSVILNRDYAKSDGSIQMADGTIRFTGRYTAADLAEMKGSAGTAAELTNSLTSVITGQVQLMGGTLSIEDGAVLQVSGLITTDDAPADLMLHNGTLSTLAEDGAITLGSGSILTMSGTSSLSGAVSTVEHIQATVDLSLAQQGVAQLGLYGSLVTPGIDLTITGLSPMNRGVYVLLDASATLAEGQHWQDIISVNVDESLASQLMWDGNRLIFDSRRSYNYIGNSASQHEQSVWEFFDAGIRFEDNHVIDGTYEDGGALAAAIDPIRFSDNGDILFRNNSLVDGSGGAIHAGDSLTFSTNGDIAFIGNSTQSDSYSGNGGALYVRYSLNFTDNGTVLFNENSLSVCADAHGGAIYAHSSVDFTGNSVVNFGGNSAISRFGNACGGAIDAGYAGCSLGFSSNGSIIFQVNHTESPSGYSHGGAIYAGSSLSFNHNGNILFDGNSATGSAGDTRGGAIYTGGWMDWSHNGEITFSRNSANYGGAIFAKASGTSNFIGNGDIAFQWNLASGGERGEACGGAIELDNDAALSFSGNGNIVFERNLAVSPSDACGAAIHTGMNARVDVNGNGDITFLGNTATGSGGDACGGALMADDQSHLTFTDNGDITFAGNAADTAVEGGEARGGAIVVEEQSRLVFRDNTELRFSGNRAAAAVAAYGGAIYGGSGSQLTIQGSALLERNVELTYGSEARLRSIYQEDGGDFIELSAASGKSIEVRDSIYSGANYVIFNANYLKSDGSVQTADGTIRFTGKYTASDLEAAKGEAVSAAEVAHSRTSELTGEVRLMNGTLSVEDGAALKVGGLYAMVGSTLALSDAALDAGSAEINLNSGTTLALKGANSINASSLVMEGGSTLSFRLATGPNAEAPLMALSGNLQTGSLNVVLENARLAYGTYKLLTLADGNAAYDWAQSWTEEKIHVQDGAQFGDFVWRDGSLYVSCHEGTVWESSSGVWESSNTEPEAGKLVFTNEGAGSVTLSGTVTADTVLVQNDIDNNYTWTGSGSLTGDTLLGKNGEGTLRIETANSYSGGTVISGGTLEAAHTEALGSGDVSLQAGTLVVAAGAVNNKVEVSQDATVAFGENSSAVKGTVTATADGVSLNPGELRYDADSQTLTVQGAQGHTLVLRDVLVDMAAGTVLRMEHVTLTSSARLTDDTATLLANGLTVEVTSANARLQEGAQALSVSSLTACRREVSLSGQDTVWPDEGSTVCVVTLTNISDYDITGSSLHFDLSGYEAIEGATSGDYVALVFESATMDLAALTVTADILGRTYTGYYDSEQPKGAVYFDLSAAAVPEPASSALALLGLAALAVRRRRRS